MNTISVSEVLRAGFARAHQRMGAIVLDVVWKVIWLLFSAGTFVVVTLWLYAEMGSIAISGSGAALQNPLALMVLARELWGMYASTLAGVLVIFISVSAIVWIVLEAYFRAGTLPGSDDSFSQSASRHFRVYLGSSLLKLVLTVGFAGVFGMIVFGRFVSTPVAEWPVLWLDSRGAFAVVCAAGLILAFVLTMLDTLIRSDSIEAFGREFFVVMGVMATLLTLEGMILASAVIVLVAVLALASGPSGILLAAGITAVLVAMLSVLHSYLLVVRFSTLDSVARQLSEGFHPVESRLEPQNKP